MHTSLRQIRSVRTDSDRSGAFGQQRAATHHFGPLFGGSPTYLRGLPTRLRSVRAERAAAGCYGPLRTTSRRFPHLLARFADATSERSCYGPQLGGRLKLHGNKAVTALLGWVRRLGLGWLGWLGVANILHCLLQLSVSTLRRTTLATLSLASDRPYASIIYTYTYIYIYIYAYIYIHLVGRETVLAVCFIAF